MKVIFIGLSNKIDQTPLASGTLSGNLVDRIINELNYECIKTNLVDFAPTNESGKLRYPNQAEIEADWPRLSSLIDELSPCVCVCLGEKVYRFLSGRTKSCLKIRHPAYVSIYKNKDTDRYVKESVLAINKSVLHQDLSPLGLLNYLKNIQYGYVDTEGAIHTNIDDGFASEYRLRSHEDIENSSVGVC